MIDHVVQSTDANRAMFRIMHVGHSGVKGENSEGGVVEESRDGDGEELLPPEEGLLLKVGAES